jgi:hypothetical protein
VPVELAGAELCLNCPLLVDHGRDPTNGDDFLSFEKYDWRFTSSDSELLEIA